MSETNHCKELYPIAFSTLAGRLAREVNNVGAIYNLGRRQWWAPVHECDLSIDHVGRRAATPVGPASGPHTQLAHNLVLAWLGGGRFMELKTVQILDALEIPRPCISVPHVGYNVEWSQELRVHQSAEEYVKGWMLIHMLASRLGPGLWPGADVIFDMSLGYDLAGIKSDKVVDFIKSMQNAHELIERFRAELPQSLQPWANLDFPTAISGSTTLSTFHGCPADEIEAIATHTMREHHLHTVVKLNPTLLGFERCRRILNDELGYDYIQLSPEPFKKDLQWAQLMDMVPRLRAVAAEEGLEIGFKFSNTLVMQSPEAGFGEVEEMYLSGPPLHALALNLADEFRRATSVDLPITFSAGIDANNFSACVAAGLGPVTSCSDLLKGKGYGRMSRYLRNLEKMMTNAGVSTVAALRGSSDAAAKTLQTLAKDVASDRRYGRDKNSKRPRKVGSELETFDCLTCDKCIPVCPNAANFAFPVEQGSYSPGTVTWIEAATTIESSEALEVEKKHQIGCTADVCNECGQCDIWCPEDGGPYLVKPLLFLSSLTFDDHPRRDGFLLSPDRTQITWRRHGSQMKYTAGSNGAPARLELDGGSLVLNEHDQPVNAVGRGELDLRLVTSMRLILAGLVEGNQTWLAD